MANATRVIPPSNYLCRSFSLPSPLRLREAEAFIEGRINALFPVRKSQTSNWVWDAVLHPAKRRGNAVGGLLYLASRNRRQDVPFFLACLEHKGFAQGTYYCSWDGIWETIRIVEESIDYSRDSARPTFSQESTAYFFAGAKEDEESLRALQPTGIDPTRQPKRRRSRSLRAQSSGRGKNRILWGTSLAALLATLVLYPLISLDRLLQDELRVSADRVEAVLRGRGNTEGVSALREDLVSQIETLRRSYPLPVYSVSTHLLDALTSDDLVRSIQFRGRSVTFSIETQDPFAVLERIRVSPAFASFSLDQISRVDDRLVLAQYLGAWTP